MAIERLQLGCVARQLLGTWSCRVAATWSLNGVVRLRV